MEHTQRPSEERRPDPERAKEPARRADDPAEPEWVLERIQQSFETRKG